MVKEILIAAITFSCLFDTLGTSESMRTQLTLTGVRHEANTNQTERWQFTHLSLNTQFSQLNVILTSPSCQICVKSNSHISHPLL